MKSIDKIKKYIFNTKEPEQSSCIGSLELKLTKDNDIDLSCLIPDIDNKSPEELILLAENYAKFLMYIADSNLLKSDILEFLTNKSDETRDPEYKLLLDNILAFWDMYSKEYRKKIKASIKDDLPLIRPISVFSNK